MGDNENTGAGSTSDETESNDEILANNQYDGAHKRSLRPLSDFMTALVSRKPPEMLYHFWRNPYLTAMKAGVPWSVAVILAEGDVDTIRHHVDIELMRDKAAQDDYDGLGGSGGPIGVKAT